MSYIVAKTVDYDHVPKTYEGRVSPDTLEGVEADKNH